MKLSSFVTFSSPKDELLVGGKEVSLAGLVEWNWYHNHINLPNAGMKIVGGKLLQNWIRLFIGGQAPVSWTSINRLPLMFAQVLRVNKKYIQTRSLRVCRDL